MSSKSKPMHSLQIRLDHIAAIHEHDCEREFLALVRRCCRIRGPIKSQGFEELINDGVVIRSEDGIIPECVAETLAYIEGQTSAGIKGANRRKSLKTEATLEAAPSAATASPEPAFSQCKAKQDNNSEAKASSLSPPGTAQSDPSLDKSPKTAKAEVSEEFSRFWSAYPATGRQRSGKAAAWQAWQKTGAGKNPELAMRALEAAKQSRQWQQKDGEFVPGTHLWLNRGSWQEVVESPPSIAQIQIASNAGAPGIDYAARTKYARKDTP